MRAVVVIASLLSLSACNAPDAGEARRQWLQDTLVADNRALIEREPDLAAGKFAKMALGPYTYFRGTAAQYWRDCTGPGPWDVPTSHGTGALAQVLLVGDPHPENLGSFMPTDGVATVDFNDFDASRRGPSHFDVRRLAVGFWVAGAAMDLDVSERDDLAAAVVDGYVAAFDGDPTDFRLTDATTSNPIIADLLRRAVRDGDAREELDDYTVTEGGARTMRVGELEAGPAEGIVGDTVEDVGEDERRLVENLTARYRSTTAGTPPTAVLGVSRRLGAGVSSYPVRRYYILTAGPTAAADDDVLLEAKEILDPPSLTALAARPRRESGNDAERVVTHIRVAQSVADLDPLLGWAADGGFAFRFRTRTKYQKNIDVVRLAENLGSDWTFEDVTELARLAGSALAAVHARGGLPGGDDATNALRAQVGEAFASETTAFATAYGAQVLEDLETFRALLRTEGPHLGYRGGTR